jgi:hypothetical protein
LAGALSDIDLLRRSIDFSLRAIEADEAKVVAALQTSAQSGLINHMRTFRLQRSVIAIGVFSIYESLLQDELGWDEPFNELITLLDIKGHNVLSGKFGDYRRAINVLKHGLGRSHDQLINKSEELLEFKVKPNYESFFEEGDVSEGQPLIDVGTEFVTRCFDLFEDTLVVARTA